MTNIVNTNFHTKALTALNDPIEWMEMAQTLRRAADILDKQVKEAVMSAWPINQPPDNEVTVGEFEQRRLARFDTGLGRVSEMLYQMSTENAFKAVTRLKCRDVIESHDLNRLREGAGITLDKRERDYLDFLTRMNQLGRYRIGTERTQQANGKSTRKQIFGTQWTDQFRERRDVIDEKIEAEWLASGGAISIASVARYA